MIARCEFVSLICCRNFGTSRIRRLETVETVAVANIGKIMHLRTMKVISRFVNCFCSKFWTSQQTALLYGLSDARGKANRIWRRIREPFQSCIDLVDAFGRQKP